MITTSQNSGSFADEVALRLSSAAESYRQGRLDEAVRACNDLLQLDPGNSNAFHLLGLVEMSRGNLEQAGTLLRRAVSLNGDSASYLCDLGTALRLLNKLEEAVQSYRSALAIEPNHAGANNNLGTVLHDQGRWEEAIECFERALASDPDYAEAYNNLGAVLQGRGRWSEAIACYEKAVACNADYAEAHYNLGVAVERAGNRQRAIACFERAIASKPDLAVAYNCLGKALLRENKVETAAKMLGQAAALQPQDSEVLFNLGNALVLQGKFGDAISQYERSLALNPNFAEAHSNLGNALANVGMYEEAIARFRRALELDPSYDTAHSNLIFTLDMCESVGLREQQEERRRWYALHGKRFADSVKSFRNTPDPARRLRVGYVSADFNNHSAAYIFGPIIRHHDRSRFEVVCYSGVGAEDELTQVFRATSDLWRPVFDLSDDQLADLIRSDGVDILVDLSGHTSGNRLLVFARKPAPVQATAWTNATGMGTIDYFLADPIAIPSEVRRHYAEDVIELPCVLCFDGSELALPVLPLPSLGGKPLTFGCLNRIEKISDRALALWGQIMSAVPRSQLLIKDRVLDDARARESLVQRLVAHGIDVRRVQLLGKSSRVAHLETFHELDLALDPFPMNGAVSTAEALWMGVPVVALLGGTLPGRASASMLTALGMKDWIARNDADYVRIATKFAGKPKTLAKLRKGLRQKVASSCFGDVVRYTRAVEQAYRSMWRRWCKERSGR